MKSLTFEERQRLYKLKLSGHGIREIGRMLRRNPSTISRELRRNRPPTRLTDYDCYSRARYAHERALARRGESRRRKRLKNGVIRGFVVSKLRCGWSPELIAGRLPHEHVGECISHEAIYQWIYNERRDLIEHLRFAGNKRRKRAKRYRRRAKQPAAPRRPLSERPKDVDTRERFGNWEGDTIVSRQSTACLHTLVERKSRYSHLSKLSACTAANAYNATVTAFTLLPQQARQTLTHDNGPENFFHDRIEKRNITTVFFCDPYAAWQRGTVERVNGLCRRVFPKKTDFRYVTKQEIQQLQDAINHRPLKVLKFKTPYEVFHEELQKIVA